MANQQRTNNSSLYTSTSLIIMGIGLCVVVAGAIIFNYFRSKAYPELSSPDSLNDLVESVEKGRGVAYVTFADNKKYAIPWAKNKKYKEFVSLISVVSSGDIILKKKFSDTVSVRHEGKEYIYVLTQTIGR